MRFLIVLLLCNSFIQAQITKAEFTKDFALHVQTIDDFFDRFDFSENTAFRNYLQKEYPLITYSRKNFIPILFNQKGLPASNEDKEKFISQVIDSISPQFLSYRDTNWYAEITCKVMLNSKPKLLILILKVESTSDNMYSWTIVSAKADFLKFSSIKSDSILLSEKDTCCISEKNKSTTYFLTPISHGIDFTNVDNVFTNKAHINDYIYKGTRSFELCKLISLVKESKIKFDQIDKVAYHLLQIDGWILNIDYFNRKDNNSGWLISKLIKVNSAEKEKYKLTSLNIANN